MSLNLNFRGSVISNGDLSGCKSEIKLFLKANVYLKNETFTCVCKKHNSVIVDLRRKWAWCRLWTKTARKMKNAI